MFLILRAISGMAISSKGQAIELKNFCKYRKDSVIGLKTEHPNGKVMVASVQAMCRTQTSYFQQPSR